MGGWWCYDEASCKERDISLKSSNSVTLSSVQYVHDGIFSENENDNPDFYDYNHVFLYYCTSDAWSGNQSTSSLGYSFFGKNIISETAKEVFDLFSLRKENSLEIILTGSSAGGVGVMVNVDSFHELITSSLLLSSITSLNYSGIADSGLLWMLTPMDPSVLTVMDQMKMGVTLWNSIVNEKCAAAHQETPSSLYQCFFIPYNLLDIVESKLFIYEDQFDGWQISYNENKWPPDFKNNKTQLDFALNAGKYIKTQTEQQFESIRMKHQKKGIFMSSCFNHCAVTSKDFVNFGIKDNQGNVILLKDVVHNWKNEITSKPSVLFSECEEIDCSYGCPTLY